MRILVLCTLLVFSASLERSSHSNSVIVVPSSICGNAGNSLAVCDPLSSLRLCSNLTIVTDNEGTISTDGSLFLSQLAAGLANELVVMSHQVVSALEQQVFRSSTAIATAIAQLLQQFGWTRFTVVADIADTYFLHTAEEVYRIANFSDSDIFQLRNSNSDVEAFINTVDKKNFRIIILSMTPHLVSKVLCRANERGFVWPEYAWIVHSVEVSEMTCDNSSLDAKGVISVQLNETSNSSENTIIEGSQYLQGADIEYLNSCTVSNTSDYVVRFEHIGIPDSIDNETGAPGNIPFPSDLPPQFVPTFFIAAFYLVNTLCFIICTVSLVLYLYYRNEPAIKATSVSLSILIYIGCYIVIFYLYILNSFLLPSLHEQSRGLRDTLCGLRTSLHGLGIALALVLSTLTVKLIRIYRLFKFRRRVSKFTSSNLALAACVLLMAAPNVVVSVIWATVDPYRSVVKSEVRNGFLHISVECVSQHTIIWLLMSLLYIIIISIPLVTFAILTRRINYKDFKDTKKISGLSFAVLFTSAITLLYWYTFRIIGADVLFFNAVLQSGHYCVVLECQGFIFGPKLYPIVKERLKNKVFIRKYFHFGMFSSTESQSH